MPSKKAKNAARFYNEITRSLEPYIPGEQPKVTGSIIKINTNESPFPPPPKVIRAIKRFPFEALRLYPEPDIHTLRAAIAARYNTSADRIHCGNGSDEILADIFNAFASKKSLAVFTDPTYTLYVTLAKRFGIPSRSIPTESDFSIDLDKIPNRANVLFFLANPNAQTGLFIPIETVRKFLAGFKGLLILDEAYVDFAAESGLSLAKEFDNIIVTRTCSKSFSLCGLRVGYCFANPVLIDGLARVKDSYNLNILSQRAATAAMEDYEYVMRNVKRIVDERERVFSVLTKRGFTVLPGQGNFLLANPNRISAKELYEALKKRNIFVRYFSTSRLRDYVRITIGTRAQNDTLLKAIHGIVG
ncbi:MAG: histidinol-phosphate transaminase [Spirochaetes bacterium]|nr:histidinol-phosphate transaminase [Spirochaetota bacterium]